MALQSVWSVLLGLIREGRKRSPDPTWIAKTWADVLRQTSLSLQGAHVLPPVAGDRCRQGESEAAAMGREKGMLQPGPGGEEDRARSRFMGAPEPCRGCARGSI